MQVFPRIYEKCCKNAPSSVKIDQHRAIMGFDDNIIIINDFQLAKCNLASLIYLVEKILELNKSEG